MKQETSFTKMRVTAAPMNSIETVRYNKYFKAAPVTKLETTEVRRAA